jgi:hypothetical protein
MGLAALVKLFSINAPGGANGPMNGITGTGGQLSLKSGVHIFVRYRANG